MYECIITFIGDDGQEGFVRAFGPTINWAEQSAWKSLPAFFMTYDAPVTKRVAGS